MRELRLKPKLLDAYIVKKFIIAFFISLLLISVVVIVFDLSEKIDDFVSKEAPLKAIVKDYYMNYIPYLMNMFSPLFVFITVIFFTSRMAANTEIIAILSGGISFHRLMFPYMFSAAVICVFSLGLSLYVIPQANSKRIPFEQQYLKNGHSNSSRNMHYQISPGEFVYVESFSPWNNTAYKFTLERIENNELTSKLTAETAEWDSTFAGWRLKKWFIRDYTDAVGDEVRSGARLDTVINLKVNDFYMNKKTITTLSQKKLNELIETQKMRGDANVQIALIEKNTRLALPFSAFILTIIGVSLSSKKRRGGIGWNIAIGIALSFTYILFLKFSEMFVYTGMLPPWIALWLPNLVFAIIAGALYRIAPK